MQMRKYQGGLGTLGWLFVLAIGAFLFTCVAKVGPIYLDYWQTKKAIDLVLNNSALATKSRPEIIAAIEKQFEINNIDSVKPTDIKLTESKGTRELDASYEKRVALISNIDVVVKFDKLKYNLSAVQ
ncbi:MAG: hypothetical protein JWM78_1189 [Verrucomicrobiaceae bacterium]|nr:hypothetical protein [Verrucomicrobiaceae bacterium]